MAEQQPSGDVDVQVQGALVRGLIDRVARTEGVAGVGEVLGQFDLTGPEVEPTSWYSMELLVELVELMAERSDEEAGPIAYQSGRRMASSALDELGPSLVDVAFEDLVARLDRLVRIDGEPAIHLSTEDDHVVLTQDPPGGELVCPIFHGIVEGLIEHLVVVGRIDRADARRVSCRREGADRCVYDLERVGSPPAA